MAIMLSEMFRDASSPNKRTGGMEGSCKLFILHAASAANKILRLSVSIKNAVCTISDCGRYKKYLTRHKSYKTVSEI